jgi:hypothetical protein
LPGGTLKSVQKALARGWITAERDGRIEPRTADAQWAALHVPRVVVSAPGLCGSSWAPPEMQSKRWRACRRDLRHIQDILLDDWTRLGEPVPPTGIPRLDAFLSACDHVLDAILDLDKTLQQYGYSSRVQ